MDNRKDFEIFVKEDFILNNGEPYALRTKQDYLEQIDSFIEKSKINLYDIDESNQIKELLEEKKIFIKNYSKNNMKRGIEWYLIFLESKLTDFKLADEVSSRPLHEGAKKKIYVNAYERNAKARKKCIENYGAICSVCNFDFEKIYGSLGEGYIHVHHLKPLSEIEKEYEVNPIEDLRPVCPNCHAMLHKKKPTASISELKELLKLNNDSDKKL